MAKKKSAQRQFSLLELIPECIENLRQECEKEEAYTRRMLGSDQPVTNKENEHVRQTNGSRTNSNESNGQGNIQLAGLDDAKLLINNSPENIGQMGAEQSGEIERTRENRERRRIAQQVRRTSGTGDRSDGNEQILGFDRQRTEPLGSIGNDGDKNRTLTNYVITESDNIGVGTPKQKYQDNINALKVLYHLRKEKAAAATKEEQAILVKYVGWGGLPQVFDEQNQDWQKEYKELKALLSEEDYKNARRSTQDAHFTPKNIIDTMYQGLKQFGVKDTVRILEPAAGIGNFIGFKPQDFNANFTTIEQDTVSADILGYLYPQEKKFITPYQETLFKSPLFDITIGNPPFGQTKLYDRNFPQLDFSMHNYFIAKSMELVKEGGLGAFVVSRYFLDSADSRHREFIAENSHFLGAIRLPNTAFKQNALTEVTTDIVFFQKKTEQEKQNNITKGYADWVNTAEKEFEQKVNVTFLGRPIPSSFYSEKINKYFIDKPEQVIGNLEFISSRFGKELSCVPNNDVDMNAAMQNALQALPKNIFDNAITHKNLLTAPREYTELEKRILTSDRFKKLKVDSLIDSTNGRIYKKSQGETGEFILKEVPLRYSTDFQRISGLIQIRDNLRTLFELEKSPENNEAEIEKYRSRLNGSYNHFVNKFGLLNSDKNRNIFAEDPEATLIQALEVDYDKGVSKKTALKEGVEQRKASIFSKRCFYAIEPIKSAETSKEALLISLRERGTIDFEYMAILVGKSEEEVKQELTGTLVFENPETQKYEIADKYLTGNVRKKLAAAKKAAADNPQYQMNIQALEKAMPKDIEPADISVHFGSTWIPEEDMKQFINEVIGEMPWNKNELHYLPEIGKWAVNIGFNNNSVNKYIFGTEEYPASKIIKSLLENTNIKVMKDSDQTDDKGKPIRIVDTDATAAAMEKAEKIQEAFKNWIWNDEDRRNRLAKLYNEKFNTHVPVQYDGSHVELVGASYGITLREHQKNAIWRAMQEGTALFDHVVGAGKTFEAIGTMMESKWLGLMKKPMITVPNHLVYQWRDEFYKLYPDANILVAEKKDFLKENRERLFGKIATGSWDAVIIPHTSFKFLEMPKEYRDKFYQREIDQIETALLNIDRDDNKITVKQLEKQKERLIQKHKKVLEGDNRSKNVDFSDLGVDALFVDEVHEFKNLELITSLSVSGLGTRKGSDKSMDLYIKCRYIQDQNNGKGVYFLTGTPISNSISEVYTMQKYMQTDVLEEKGIIHFDAWASTFGRITSNWELDATGVNYALKSRFANFDNVPELLSMYRTFADVVTRNDINEQQKKNHERSITPPLLDNQPINIVVERSPVQAEYMNDIIHRMENLPRDTRIDNPLKITNDARKAGLDYRLIDPNAPDFENSKVNVCADKIYKIWQDTMEDKGTQLVFCDLSTPKGFTKQDLKKSKIKDDEAEQEDKDKEQDDEDVFDMDELLSLNSNFSVYDDLKKKLIAKGIPEKEIAFIHDAKTELKKEKLFHDVSDGRVRVLLGSTRMMGSGMNVQERLVAAHHLDAPWRPSDLEQRNGRIIRQGNELYKKDPDNFKIQIYNYATKQTYDARMWQTIEYKSAAIEQFRKGDILQRSIEDVQSEAANAAEMKAAASGNPLILLEVGYKAEVKKLEALYNQFLKNQHSFEKRISYLKKADERIALIQEKHDKACVLRDKNKIEQPEIMVNGQRVTGENSSVLATAIKAGVQETQALFTSKPTIGVYRGFEVKMQNAPCNGEKGFKFVLSMPDGGEYSPKNLAYTEKDNFSLSGFFTRLDNFLEKGLDEEFQTEKAIFDTEKKELAVARQSLRNAKFEQMDELEVARHNHNAVLRELNYMSNDKDYVSKFKPLTVEEHKANKAKEQVFISQNKGLTR